MTRASPIKSLSASRSVALAVVVALALSGVQPALGSTRSPVAAPVTMDEIIRLSPAPGGVKARVRAAKEAARVAIVHEAGLGMGVRGGYSARAKQLRTQLDASQPELDRIFNFVPFVERGRLLLPLIERVDDVQAIEGGVLRETGQVYRVVEAARVVTAPPTWRDYMRITPLEMTPPDDTVLPSTREEREAWTDAVQQGWEVGVRQADAVFSTDLEVMTHAYQGRLLYRTLTVQGMIRPASLAHSDFGVVREDADETLRVGDALYSVADSASFTDQKAWRAVARPSKPMIRPASGSQTADDSEPVIRPAHAVPDAESLL